MGKCINKYELKLVPDDIGEGAGGVADVPFSHGTQNDGIDAHLSLCTYVLIQQ